MVLTFQRYGDLTINRFIHSYYQDWQRFFFATNFAHVLHALPIKHDSESYLSEAFSNQNIINCFSSFFLFFFLFLLFFVGNVVHLISVSNN